jgi:Zn-dependent protease with chaperone function
MHFVMWLMAFILAVGLRWFNWLGGQTWEQRWHRALGAFVLPPLLMVMTGVAIVCMGPQGQMGHWHTGRLSYASAIVGLGLASFLALKLMLQAHRTLRQVRSYALQTINGNAMRLFDSPLPFVAQIGFWHPELVVSRGLLQVLDAPHLAAVLVHEQAHHHYRDTFWFFGLGWLRRLSAWLPQTEALWQELLMLRELRADRWAAQQVDSLLLAEALLVVASAPTQPWEGVGLENAVTRDRLTERIDALLMVTPLAPEPPWRWLWLLLALLPLLAIPFHR